MLPVEQDVIDLIDSRVESFDLRQEVGNDIARQAANDGECCYVEGKEIRLCHGAPTP